MFIILEREAVSQQQFIVRLGAVVIEDFRLRLDAVGTSRERYRFPIAAPLDFCTLAVVEQVKEWEKNARCARRPVRNQPVRERGRAG